MFVVIACFCGVCFGELSCVSSRQVVYFQDNSGAKGSVPIAESYVPRIKQGDVLSIQVSSLNADASAFFNPHALTTLSTGRTQQQANTSGLPEMAGYLVAASGEIELPLVGRLSVGDLTVSECSALIKQKLSPFLKEPTVNVRNQNFRISVLGEVTRPALFTIPNDQVTLIEALSLAGDATIYGRRDNVLVIREESGKKTFSRVDLTQRNLFRSPYYYLHPNDIVYVEPGKARVANADRFYLIVPTVLSALSFIAILLTRN
ncbi:polysaccharide export protein [Spirosoma sp. KCTC 42546]|uniref:polysaccharide biosynthesis/export family protein n=1 Tax=Spirosoma sp. KCTC 42546 TaxID=2520506 RepID=UPI00115C1D77|nr:polysaccharide biosynthesis/export family protein [Spirosoma sp. KCTC 42546]QDK80127.1 polysaccharide export protein [Spirosoma sp. KCTC 42546]